MGDLHQVIVDHVGEVIGGCAVRLDKNRVCCIDASVRVCNGKGCRRPFERRDFAIDKVGIDALVRSLRTL